MLSFLVPIILNNFQFLLMSKFSIVMTVLRFRPRTIPEAINHNPGHGHQQQLRAVLRHVGEVRRGQLQVELLLWLLGRGLMYIMGLSKYIRL